MSHEGKLLDNAIVKEVDSNPCMYTQVQCRFLLVKGECEGRNAPPLATGVGRA